MRGFLKKAPQTPQKLSSILFRGMRLVRFLHNTSFPAIGPQLPIWGCFVFSAGASPRPTGYNDASAYIQPCRDGRPRPSAKTKQIYLAKRKRTNLIVSDSPEACPYKVERNFADGAIPHNRSRMRAIDDRPYRV